MASLDAATMPGTAARAGEAGEPAAWSPFQRFLFRFACGYLLLQLLPAYLDLLALMPHGGAVGDAYMRLWAAAVPWIGRHLLHVEAPYRLTGSSDSLFSWVEALCFLALSLAAAVVWTLLDRRGRYGRLFQALRVFVRIGLGTVLIGYGAAKVVPTQFPPLLLSRLAQPFGDASPMGLLWTFLGASAPYQIFAGLLELGSGVLLLFRRTAPLGALAAIAVLANVVMLNFCYDVPVKLLSLHLLAMAVFLAAPELRRLFDLLVRRRPVTPRADPPFFRSRSGRIAALVLEGALAAGFTGFLLRAGYQELQAYEGVSRIPLYGIWRVDDLRIDGHPGGAATADNLRWRSLIFDFPGVMAVQSPEESRRPYSLELDAPHKTLALTWPPQPQWKALLSYGQPAPGRLTVAGAFDGHRVWASLHRVDAARLPLVSRGFRWVSETPFNR